MYQPIPTFTVEPEVHPFKRKIPTSRWPHFDLRRSSWNSLWRWGPPENSRKKNGEFRGPRAVFLCQKWRKDTCHTNIHEDDNIRLMTEVLPSSSILLFFFSRYCMENMANTPKSQCKTEVMQLDFVDLSDDFPKCSWKSRANLLVNLFPLSWSKHLRYIRYSALVDLRHVEFSGTLEVPLRLKL